MSIYCKGKTRHLPNASLLTFTNMIRTREVWRNIKRFAFKTRNLLYEILLNLILVCFVNSTSTIEISRLFQRGGVADAMPRHAWGRFCTHCKFICTNTNACGGTCAQVKYKQWFFYRGSRGGNSPPGLSCPPPGKISFKCYTSLAFFKTKKIDNSSNYY